MPCGKRPLVKLWDKPKHIGTVKPSRYQQNEASVKVHWKKVVNDLELSYKDDKFWDSQSALVRELVGPHIFQRLAKIFNLPPDVAPYAPQSEPSSLAPSAQFYTVDEQGQESNTHDAYSLSEYAGSFEEEEAEEEELSEEWSVSSVTTSAQKISRSKPVLKSSKSLTKSTSKNISKSFSKIMAKSLSMFLSKQKVKSYSSKMASRLAIEMSSDDSTAFTDDDMKVHTKSFGARKVYKHHSHNPHFDMLYCNDSETDMIKWNSKYKQKTFEVSASDEFSKKAELLTKQIAFEFFEWWVGLGNVEFKSEIKRPEDIEALFQVWFDEHASRGLMLDPKILPCVLSSIAEFVGVPKSVCPQVLKRQIAFDIHAETSPIHDRAFDTCLPMKLKHIPPKNNTKEMWHSVRIPKDLKSMACVWQDISHLTSVKAFQKWLRPRSHMPMPPILQDLDTPGDKKQRFVVPSDFVIRGQDSFSGQDLAIPISQFSMEIKEVLSKLLND